MLGNLVISVIAGVLTLVWLLIFGVPYAAAAGDRRRGAGPDPGGRVSRSAASGQSGRADRVGAGLPGDGGFFVLYRFVEDYLLVPRIIGGAVKVPALVTVVAVLLGGALLGVIGALVAIPIAAAIQLIIRETLIPRLDQT